MTTIEVNAIVKINTGAAKWQVLRINGTVANLRRMVWDFDKRMFVPAKGRGLQLNRNSDIANLVPFSA